MVTSPVPHEATRKWLLCRAGDHACGLPIEAVRLTLRRSQLDSWKSGDAPGEGPVTEGVATIRGEAVPVVSLGRLLSGGDCERESRLVLLGLEGRHVALGVSSVVGVRSLPVDTMAALPPLLGDERASVVERLGRLDGELLLLLRAARLLSEGALERSEGSEAPA